MEQEYRIAQLIHNHFKGEISREDEQELLEWIKKHHNNQEVLDRANNPENLKKALETYELFDSEEAWKIIDGKLYLGWSKSGIDEFQKNAASNIERADQNWEKLLSQN